MPALYFIIGATCTGKTALALEWARANNAEILCADAPLVYRGMEIGAAKPTKEQRSLAVHHGIDLVGVKEKFNVGDYAKYAKGIVEGLKPTPTPPPTDREGENRQGSAPYPAAAQSKTSADGVRAVGAEGVAGRSPVHNASRNLLIVGGSGFYLKSFFEPATDSLAISPQIAREVEAIFEKEKLEGLLKKLRAAGGRDLRGLDVQNPRRVMKALERSLASKKSYQELRAAFENQPPPYLNYEKKVTMLSRRKEDLRARIEKRAQGMLDAGLIDEAAALDREGLRENPAAASVIGYRETLEFIDGKISREELKERIVKDTMELVRKQTTFFKLLPVTKKIELAEGKRPDAGGIF